MGELLDKYRELYLLSKEASANEIDRIRRIEDKSAKMITLCGILIAFAGFVGKFVLGSFFPPNVIYDWLCLISFFSFVVAILYAFVNLLGVLNIINISIKPMNQQMITFFDQNSHINILYALAKSNAEAIAFNTKQYYKKLWKLKCSYWAIHCSLAFIIIFIASQLFKAFVIFKRGG